MTPCKGSKAPAETTADAETTAAEETTTAEADTNETDSGDFTLLDVTTDMIQAGVCAMDENGTIWTLLTVSDVYTEQSFEIGFAETDDDKVYIMNSAGEVMRGSIFPLTTLSFIWELSLHC